jgi:hypothetical protein
MEEWLVLGVILDAEENQQIKFSWALERATNNESENFLGHWKELQIMNQRPLLSSVVLNFYMNFIKGKLLLLGTQLLSFFLSDLSAPLDHLD